MILFIGMFLVWSVFGEDASCPAEKSKKLTAEEVGAKIQQCLDARENKKEASITEFYCPSGDFSYEDSRILDNRTLPYHVAVSLFFAEIDKDALSYMCDLREMREKDPMKWTEDARKKIEITGNEENLSFAERYNAVCSFSFIADRINTPEKEWIGTTETYPQSICQRIAVTKAQAWSNMSTILMGDGIAKSWQNDKDDFVEKVKGKYTVVYDKYLRYKRIAERAIKGLTALAKDTIRR